MKSKIYNFSVKMIFLAILFVNPDVAFSQSQQATMLGNWDDTSLPVASFIGNRYNDIWGVVVNGVEYAAIGSCNGVHFIDIDNPNGPTEVAYAAAAHQGTSIIHRDFHSYQNYLYTVADEGGNSTLQIIDFSGLPNSVEIVYDSNEFFTTAHNIFIDEENARLYTTEGITVLSLANPEQPVFLDNLASNGLPVPGYSHDIFVRDNIIYMNCGNAGFYVVDYTDVYNPIPLGSMTDYPQSGYNHSGWLSDDGSHYFLCDETHGMDVKSVDVSDFSDIGVVDLFSSNSTSATHIAHNAMVRGDLLFVSYYYDGLQVFDISDPENVVRKYHYDTYPGNNDDFYEGAWGVYALLPSGRILLSDMQTGLYVFELPADVGLYASQSNFDVCLMAGEESVDFDLTLGNDFDASGVNVTVTGTPSAVTVDFDGDMLAPGSTINVAVSGLTTVNNFDLVFTANDGTETVDQTIQINVVESLLPITIGIPANASTDISLSPNFYWQPLSGISGAVLEVSTSPDFAAASIVSAEAVNNAPYQLANDLLSNTTYYWRINSLEDCAASEVFSFTTETLINTTSPEEAEFRIYPNPAKESIHVQMLSNSNEMLQIQLSDVTGRVIQQWNQLAQGQITLQPSVNLSGLYLLSVKSGQAMTTKTVVIE